MLTEKKQTSFDYFPHTASQTFNEDAGKFLKEKAPSIPVAKVEF